MTNALNPDPSQFHIPKAVETHLQTPPETTATPEQLHAMSVVAETSPFSHAEVLRESAQPTPEIIAARADTARALQPERLESEPRAHVQIESPYPVADYAGSPESSTEYAALTPESGAAWAHSAGVSLEEYRRANYGLAA